MNESPTATMESPSTLPATVSAPVATSPARCTFNDWCTAGDTPHDPCTTDELVLTVPGHDLPRQILDLVVEDYGQGPRLTFSGDGGDCTYLTAAQARDLCGQTLDHVVRMLGVIRRYEALTATPATQTSAQDPSSRITAIASEVDELDRIRVRIGDSDLVACLDRYEAEPKFPATTELTFGWSGIDDVELPLPQAAEVPALLHDFADRLAAAMARAAAEVA